MEDVFGDYHSSHSFSLTVDCPFHISEEDIVCHVSFFLSFSPFLKKEKGSEWWRSWLWSFPVGPGSSRGQAVFVNPAH